MIVKAIYKDKDRNYFRDIKTRDKRVYGDIFECDDDIAQERIEKKLVKPATKKEAEEYLAKISASEVAKDVVETPESTNSEGTEEKDNSNVDPIVDYTTMSDEELLNLALSKGIRIEEDKYNREETIELLTNTIDKVNEEENNEK